MPITCTILPSVLSFSATILTISTIQWICIFCYQEYCMDKSFWGLFTNAFTLGSPVCQFLNNSQLLLAQQYVYFWTYTATAAVGWFIRSKCYNINSKNSIDKHTKKN